MTTAPWLLLGAAAGCSAVPHSVILPCTSAHHPAEAECGRFVYSVHAPEAGAVFLSRFVSSSALGVGRVVVNFASMPLDFDSAGSSTARLNLTLQRGLNIVELEAPRAAAPELFVEGAVPLPAAGAIAPFVDVEAEDSTTSGQVIGPSYAFMTLPSEASARMAVTLAPGQWVDFVVPPGASTNALSLRYSIPDAPAGWGITAPGAVYVNGALAAHVNLTSRFTWLYGPYPYVKDPSRGGPKRFYDTLWLALPSRYPPGTVIRFLNPLFANATSITVDVLSLWDVPDPLPQPAGSLSVLSYGADPSGRASSAGAFIAAMDAGAAAGVPVWIPQGTFSVPQWLHLPSNLTLIGAGHWHTVLTGPAVGLYGTAHWHGPRPTTNVRLRGLSLHGETTFRVDTTVDSGIGGVFSASVFADVRIWHTKVGVWIDGPSADVLFAGLVLADTRADGLNLYRGVERTVVEHTVVRNPGDDGMAMWSLAPQTNAGNTFRHSTVLQPVLANNFAIYGGAGNALVRNVAVDTVQQGGGFHVGNRFDAVPLSGTTVIDGNFALRSGCLDPNWNFGVASLWFYALDSALSGRIDVVNNVALDSPYSAVQFIGGNVTNVHIRNLTAVNVGTYVFQFQAPAHGTVAGVVARGAQLLGQYSCAPFNFLADGGGNTGWGTTGCPVFPSATPTSSRPPHGMASPSKTRAGTPSFSAAPSTASRTRAAGPSASSTRRSRSRTASRSRAPSKSRSRSRTRTRKLKRLRV